MDSNKMVDDVKIGADIEVFLQHLISGEIISAEGIIQGTKKEPYKFKNGDPYFATSLDNIMAEFCIPPVNSSIDFFLNTRYAIEYINSILPKNVTTLIQPAAKINPDYLQTENAKLFGCDPDLNAWTGLENPRPEAADSNLRSCGGHIHFSYKNPNSYVTGLIIKAMDIAIGVPSVIQEPDNDRKLLYGKAGAYREKSYGGEYRTVSNYYLASKQLTEWIYNQTMWAIDFVNKGGFFNFPSDTEEKIQNCINYCRKDTALALMKQFNIKLAA